MARAMGADEVVRSDGPWLEDVRALTDGRGVDVVLDPVGGDRFTDSLRSLDMAGRLIVIGFTGGSIPVVKVNRLLLRNLTVTGIGARSDGPPLPRHRAADRRRRRRRWPSRAASSRWSGTGCRCDQGAEALRLLDRREALGKVVVDVR